MRKWTILFVLVLLPIFTQCGKNPDSPDTELQPPEFHIAYIQFTGDSTGASNPARTVQSRSEVEDSRGTPYCQITVGWYTPEVDSVLAYALFRATEPGVQESGQATLIATTSDTLAVDSYQLDWGTTYYYAVRALDQDSTEFWSDEASIATPNYQYPTPSILSAIDLPMGRCILQWTMCPDDDFGSYILLKNAWPHMYHSDTLGTFTDVSDTTFTDSLPPFYSPSYYQVVTTDTQGISVLSNLLEYVSDLEMPWIATKIRTFGYIGYSTSIKDLSFYLDGQYLYLLVKADTPGGYYSVGLSSISTTNYSETGNLLGHQSEFSKYNYSIAPEQNAVLVSSQWHSSSSYEISLMDHSSLDEIRSTSLSYCGRILAMPTGGRGIFECGGGFSAVLDLNTMAVIDSLDYTFSWSQIVDGNVYIIDSNGYLSRIDSSTLEIAASSNNEPLSNLVLSSDGMLCFIDTASRFVKIDPYTLAEVGSAAIPFSDLREATLLEADGRFYAYLFGWYGGNHVLRVYDIETGEYLGDVISDITGEPGIWYVDEIVSNPQLNQIWFCDTDGNVFLITN